MIKHKGWAGFGLLVAALAGFNAYAGIIEADLSITKTDGVTTAVPGGQVTYTITASNAGPGDAPNTTISDTFAAVLNCSWTCSASMGSSCTAAGSGDINDLANLLVGGSVTYTAVCDISPDATGTLVNTATVTPDASITDNNTANNTATDSDTLTPIADLSVTKTDNQTAATAGEPISYVIVASNAGPSTVSDAVVTDIFQAPLENCSWTSVAAGGAAGNSSASGNLNDVLFMPPGSSVTYDVICDVALDAFGPISNTATISSATADDPTPGNDSATDDDTIVFGALVVPTLGTAGLAILLALLALFGFASLRRRHQN